MERRDLILNEVNTISTVFSLQYCLQILFFSEPVETTCQYMAI